MRELNAVDWASLTTAVCLRDTADKIKHEKRTLRATKSSHGRADVLEDLQWHPRRTSLIGQNDKSNLNKSLIICWKKLLVIYMYVEVGRQKSNINTIWELEAEIKEKGAPADPWGSCDSGLPS